MDNNLEILFQSTQIGELRNIVEKVYNKQRISPEEAILLYQDGSLSFVGTLADYIRQNK
ncbi:MAG: aminofutalosine synthase MqnE, partial [Saprospiraceae bacterium]|nr:aminofutalosine synthase MqnE [Saprospiraceae bacterium]